MHLLQQWQGSNICKKEIIKQWNTSIHSTYLYLDKSMSHNPLVMTSRDIHVCNHADLLYGDTIGCQHLTL